MENLTWWHWVLVSVVSTLPIAFGLCMRHLATAYAIAGPERRAQREQKYLMRRGIVVLQAGAPLWRTDRARAVSGMENPGAVDGATSALSQVRGGGNGQVGHDPDPVATDSAAVSTHWQAGS